MFVDFSKADRLPEDIRVWGDYGKSNTKDVCVCTNNVLKSATINAAIGVRRKAPTRCLRFIHYMCMWTAW